MAASQTVLFLVAMVLSLSGLIHSFQPLFSSDRNSTTHRDITERAILRKTAEVCRDIAASEGRPFSLTIDDSLSPDKVQRACSSTGISTSTISSVIFQTSIVNMYLSNAQVDVAFALSEKHHFDDETFPEGRDVITAGVSAVKASVNLENFVAGRWTLGKVFHTLQDFYSHSNWLEMGNTDPYSTLIKPDQPLENLAGPRTPTCINCIGENCENNLLPLGLLTSGYFNVFSSTKPAGKCSHGGSFDLTSELEPVGGISKDDVGSSHGSLHHKAADLAVNATMELLEDIRVAVGDKDFLRLMGLSQSPVLCFVIDTTGSMRDDIDEAKRVSFLIIDSKRGTEQEPSAYILVPFNDPGFGPLTMTTDADVFKNHINNLTANGGGDNPELSLSGLQLALTAAPPSSEIFVFTDAPAKDAHLKSTITALIESTKSEVTFMLTDVLARRRRRRSPEDLSTRRISQLQAQLYRDIARASGGQVIEVTKSDLTLATSVIEDSSAGAVVTVFQEVRNPGRPDNFTFTVDRSLRNLTAYITGASSLTFTLTSSTGVSQNSNQSSGPLATFITAGNLRRLSINIDNQTGLWEININSDNPYSVKVTGQSSVNFIYNLMEVHEGAHGDFSLKEGRLLSGGKATMLVSVTGGDKVNVTGVSLFDSSGPTEVNGSLQSVGSGDFLVTFNKVPAGDFVVCIRGEDSNSTSRSMLGSFRRQASTVMKTSNISVTTQANNTNIEPGSTISVPFTVATTTNGVVDDTATGVFTVRANNDRSYTSTSPSTVTIEAGSGGKAKGTVTLTAPASAASGTDLTLIIEAENADATDINYAVLRFSVAAEVTDITPPVCHQNRTVNDCPSSLLLCASSQWTFLAMVTEVGSGIDNINIRHGDGTIHVNTDAGEVINWSANVTYTGSCCSQSAELALVDNAGNVGKCVVDGSNTTPSNTGGHTLSILHCLWISVVVSLLWK